MDTSLASPIWTLLEELVRLWKSFHTSFRRNGWHLERGTKNKMAAASPHFTISATLWARKPKDEMTQASRTIAVLQPRQNKRSTTRVPTKPSMWTRQTCQQLNLTPTRTVHCMAINLTPSKSAKHSGVDPSMIARLFSRRKEYASDAARLLPVLPETASMLYNVWSAKALTTLLLCIPAHHRKQRTRLLHRHKRTAGRERCNQKRQKWTRLKSVIQKSTQAAQKYVVQVSGVAHAQRSA